MVLRSFFVDAYAIPTASMEPALLPGDRILVSRCRGSEVERGDIVVFDAPDADGERYVKRVVGLGGDLVGEGSAAILVPPAHLFVRGDNEALSYDSRQFGPIHQDKVLGRVRMVFWSSETVSGPMAGAATRRPPRGSTRVRFFP